MTSSGDTTANLSVTELYDDVGIAYQDAFGYYVPAHLRSLDRLILQLPPESKVVDLGCGTGRPACEMLVRSGHQVTGVDIAPKMTEYAKAQVPEATFYTADFRSWQPPQSDLPYDAAVAYFSLLTDMSQQDIRDFFPLVAKWLKPDGLLAFATVPADVEHVQGDWLARRFVASSLDRAQIVEAIHAAGMVVDHIEVEDYVPRGTESGLCDEKNVAPESHLFVHARKSPDKRAIPIEETRA